MAEDWAVLLIDMQTWYVRGLRAADKRMLVASHTAVLEYCAAEDIPVIVFKADHHKSDIEPSLRACLAKVPRTHTIEKEHTDGFRETDADLKLKEWGATKLLLMGVQAYACVLDTATGAAAYGYELVTGEYLIANSRNAQRDKEQAAFEQMGARFLAAPMPLDELFAT